MIFFVCEVGNSRKEESPGSQIKFIEVRSRSSQQVEEHEGRKQTPLQPPTHPNLLDIPLFSVSPLRVEPTSIRRMTK